MSIEFDFYENPKSSPEEEQKYHVRAITRNTVSTEKIIEEIHESTSLTPGDIRSALTSLSNQLIKHLANSERIHLEGIGYFQPTLTYSKDIDPKKTRAQSVWFKSVKFRADKSVKQRLQNVHTERTQLKRHSYRLSVEQIDEKLTAHFATNETLSRKQLEALCGFTRTTAARHMNRLVKENKIRNINIKNQPVYKAAPGFYGTPGLSSEIPD